MNAFLPPLVAVTESEPAGPSNVGLGSVVLTIAIAVFLIWVGYAVINSRRRTRPPEAEAPNQEFFMDNEELENDRLTRVLTAAVISAGVLAIVMPIYFVNESSRQVAAAEEIHEDYLHFGAEWWEKFECTACHGPDAGGGGAEIVEPRSGLTANWAAPAINDVFFRYSDDEVRHWIEFGRSGTPMPANSLEGGGAMTVQEVDQVIAYLESLQISQMEAFGKVDSLVETALDRMTNAETTIETRIAVESAVLHDILERPGQFSAIRKMPEDVAFLLGTNGTCTEESARLVGASCEEEGPDADRDGLVDSVEPQIEALALLAHDTVTESVVDTTTLEVTEITDPGFELSLSPTNAFSNTDASGNPIPDLEATEGFISHLDARHLELSLLTDRNDQFAEPVIEGIAFLEDALATKAWEVNFGQVAADTGLSIADSERAVGLFNAYCARCHTAGYSAGVEFEQTPGSGAWAPALTNGRTVVQFPDPEDHVNFIINGADAAAEYGVNGLSGVGGMPGFGALLSIEDIELIVAYERSM